MELTLPETIGLRDIGSLFSIAGKVTRCQDRELVLHAHEVTFIDPFGLAVLGALLGPRDRPAVSLVNLHVNQAGYLDRMNFFDHVDVDGVEVPHWNRNDQRRTLTELTYIDSQLACDETASLLADAITGTLTVEPPQPDDFRGRGSVREQLRYPLWYALSELLQNSLTHARQGGHRGAGVWVAAQYFERIGQVKLAVVDNGCGMLETLKAHEKLPELSHHAAIQTALLPKVSCNRDGRLYNDHANEGVGLTTTAKIAKKAVGGLVIVSGDAVHRTATLSGYSGVLPHAGGWQGVATCFYCKRSKLPAVRVGELLPPTPSSVDVQFGD